MTKSNKIAALTALVEKKKDGVKMNRKDRRAHAALTRQLKVTAEQAEMLAGVTQGKTPTLR